MTQRMIEITSPVFITENQIPAEGGLAALFGNDRPLALEIGCGIGDFIVQLARQKPEINFLAIDIYNKGCDKTCKKIEAEGLQNVRVMRIEARYLLAHYIAKESLEAIYINCPDPWPKKRHRSRRLVGREFMQTALYYLRPGGNFFFSTDFDDYGEQVAEIFPTVEGYDNSLPTPCVHSLCDYPISKYMRRFLDLGQPIYYVHYRKQADFAVDESILPPLDKGFRIRWDSAGNE